VRKVYIESMRRTSHLFASLLMAAALACPLGAAAQALSQYSLRLGPEARSGGGLSLEAGERWFARVGTSAGTSAAFDTDRMALGGGYRFTPTESLSMQVLRGRADRLGLAVRYDWSSYYLRLSYDRRWSDNPQDTLRFSAGMRF
jgi:hypothetical protein